jgi:hypothetical protein
MLISKLKPTVSLLFLLVLPQLVLYGQEIKPTLLNIKLSIPDGEVGQVTADFVVPEGYDFSEDLVGGGFATVDCLRCPLTASYEFWLYEAEQLENNRTRLSFTAKFEKRPRCNSSKRTIISMFKTTTVNLKCGVKVIISPVLPKGKSPSG